MPDGTDAKYPQWSANLKAVLTKLVKWYPCVLYDFFRSGPGADTRMAPYKDLLDNTPNLLQVAKLLKSLTMDNGETGYDAVLHTLIDFDPGQSWKSQERVFDCRMKTDDISIKTFLIRAVHILWMEQNGQVRWSIKNYSDDEIKGLFFEYHVNNTKNLLPAVPVESKWDGTWEQTTVPLLSLEASYKLHAISMKLKEDTPDLSAVNCIRWFKTNFFHAYDEWDFNHYTGTQQFGNGYCPPNLSRLFEERIAGCHTPSTVLSEMLRLLNIPAFPVNMIGHGVTYIPVLRRFVHGDNLVNVPLYPSDILLLTCSEFANFDTTHDLNKTIENKAKTLYPLNDALMLNQLRIQRKDTSLFYYELNWDFPADVLAMIQQEAPQFHFQRNPAGNGIVSEPVPIRSLDDFSASGSDLWH